MMQHSPLICLLPGMTQQYPVYHRLLPLLPSARVVPFIEPQPDETLQAYARRMAPLFSRDCFIGGVSFGGILAQEISRIVQPHGCIVIASIQHPSHLPPRLRMLRTLGGRWMDRLLRATGRLAESVPASVRTSSTARLRKLSGEAGRWHRWATGAVLDWQPAASQDVPLTHIHGDKDTTFPVGRTTADIIISGGKHALPVSHPEETAAAIRRFATTVHANRDAISR